MLARISVTMADCLARCIPSTAPSKVSCIAFVPTGLAFTTSWHHIRFICHKNTLDQLDLGLLVTQAKDEDQLILPTVTRWAIHSLHFTQLGPFRFPAGWGKASARRLSAVGLLPTECDVKPTALAASAVSVWDALCVALLSGDLDCSKAKTSYSFESCELWVGPLAHLL
ncbi:hypothetical protein PSTT_02444 [Puccinia striiformis]|uniref:Uncharacterized protein n=1 Tax=Puccinia striiformis TaxID=27350 RepID=A0A2S4W041_9BASI|nr:hypothetical protein PSTT_02444 [Puccinia striiformis]